MFLGGVLSDIWESDFSLYFFNLEFEVILLDLE